MNARLATAITAGVVYTGFRILEEGGKMLVAGYKARKSEPVATGTEVTATVKETDKPKPKKSNGD